jgi:PAS domain S-box-containing protein
VADLLTPFEPPADASPEELRTRLRALASLVSRAPVPIAVAHDPQCRFISANAALARLLGVDPHSNISLTPPPGEEAPYRIQRGGRDVPEEELPMQYAIAHRTRVTNDIEIVRTDGTVVYVQDDVEPLYDAQGEVCGCVSVCVDLTEHKRVQDALREADRRKDEFLATLSHELRNPLAPIRNALEVLRMAGHDRVRSERAHAIMERQLRQLVRLTDELLDVSRITRNRMELRRERIDLKVVVHSALETVQPLIDAAGHVVRIKEPDVPIWVDADSTRLAQAFGALLNNAVKYTDRGGLIEITAAIEHGSAMVAITDSGIGIKATELPRIFDMFMQADHALDRARGGLGIGLTLARRLIELHGGTLEARSRGIGHGSTFAARLPLADAPAIAQPDPAARGERRKSIRRRVLVAEDIPDAAEMMRMMLDFMGHEVRVAADGMQAVALAKEFKPQIALLDIGMPRMDGYEAGRLIRAALGPDVLMVALTGWGQEEDQRRAMEAGFDLHLTKPAEPHVLEALIASRAPRQER